MHLAPREIDKLMLHQAGLLAQKRLARGLRLNYVEAVALIATQLLEFIRDGRPVAELMDLGRRILGRADVLDGIAEMIDEVQVEGTFADGSKLVTVHHPIVAEDGDPALAFYGSFLTPVKGARAGVVPMSFGSYDTTARLCNGCTYSTRPGISIVPENVSRTSPSGVGTVLRSTSTSPRSASMIKPVP